jgi:hypothetical protein
MENELEDLKKWFEDFKVFSNQISKKNINFDKKKFISLLKGFEIVYNKKENCEREKTPNYNVFYVLKYILHKEEQLHSPFLADLLNVNGKHKQKDLFYNEFINQLELENGLEKFKVDEKIFFSVETEKWTGDGAIDIFISYNSPNKRFAIAIENKIYANDQPGQLKRYAKFLKEEFHDNFLLLYLTPRERLPVTNSIEKAEFDELCRNQQLKTITYRKHITTVLENTVERMNENKASSIIKQYLQILKNDFRHG